MDTTLTCPKCGTQVPLSKAFTIQIEKKYELEIEKIRTDSASNIAKINTKALQDIERAKQETLLESKRTIELKVRSELEYAIKSQDENQKAITEQNKKLQAQLLELTRNIREKEQRHEDEKLENEKRLNEETEKIKKELHEKLAQEFRLKDLEKDKKLDDANRGIEEMKRKLEQGSQQSQGEVLELDVQKTLESEFYTDTIQEVPKGTTGADIIQIVNTENGKQAGVIVWELKNQKAFSNDWIQKLKNDTRNLKADISILIAKPLPKDVGHFGIMEGVLIGGFTAVLPLAKLARKQILEIYFIKASQNGKESKMELLHQYVTGVEFKNRIEAMSEAFSGFQDEVEREKKWFAGKWARQEKQMRMLIDNTLGMHGEMKAIVGKHVIDDETESFNLLPNPQQTSQNQEPLI